MKKINIYIILFISSLFIIGCVKTEFDAPPITVISDELNANFSIKDLKALHSADKYEIINNDYIIKAIVIADDESGNYYKTIVVQDSTGGMELKINGTNLFNDFPIGRKIFIKCKGLVLGDYNGNFQIGGSTYLNNGDPDDERLGGIEAAIMLNFLVKGSLNNVITPTKRKIQDLLPSDQNTLVEFEGLEFKIADTAKVYNDDDVNRSPQNKTISDCDGEEIIIRTSSYADFAKTKIPNGNGKIVAVYSVFGETNQLFLRNGADVSFNNQRCNGTVKPVIDLSENFTGGTVFGAINEAGWFNINEKGTKKWIYREFDNNSYAEASSYQSGEDNSIWLISPSVNLNAPKKLSFISSMNVYKHNGLEVFITTQPFDGVNVNSVTWTKLNAIIANGSQANHVWIGSGDIDLSAYTGNARIAFKYSGNSTQNTTTYRIDDVKIQDK